MAGSIIDAQGLAVWLLALLTIRAMAQQCLAYQSAKQATAADAAKIFAVEWRMEATAHVASLMVRDQQCKGDPANCDLQEGASDAIETLSKWAVGDKGWERLLSSVSLYAIARHAYQEAEYDEAIIALEESLALRLFAYADQRTLDRWQQGLVMPGSLFRRQKMELANTLVLRSDCLVQLAREQRDVDDLTEAMELLQLATALLKGGDELVPDSVAAISRRASTIAAVAAELLPQLKAARVREVLDHHGITCAGCSSKGDFLLRLVPLLRLPVRVAPSGGLLSKASGSPVIEPLPDPFESHATALLRKPQEHVAQYMQRVFFRLLTLVPADYLAELDVACRRTDAKGRCTSYLPAWVTAQAVTIDQRTGLPQVSGPGACGAEAPAGGAGCAAAAGGGGGAALGEPFFVPGGSGGGGGGGGDTQQHPRAGVELCGFLHIRSAPPGAGQAGGAAAAATQRQRSASASPPAAAAAAAGAPPPSGAINGAVYYYYSDVPALVDRVVNTPDPDEADFLLQQLDGLTAARGLTGRLAPAQPRSCTEQALLEGKAPPGCSVLVPNTGSCARAALKLPRRRPPPNPLPPGLGLPPAPGTYTPRVRARAASVAAPAAAGGGGWAAGGGAWADNASGERRGGGDAHGGHGHGAAASRSRRGGGGHAGAHLPHHAHPHFPLTDRELSDRQLQEQMAKLARDAGRRDRDDPLVPLTLAGCAVASFGLYLASKRRRRGGGGSTAAGAGGGTAAARLVLLGLGTGRLKGSGGSGLLGSSGSGSLGAAAGTGGAVGLGGDGGDGDAWDGGGPGARRRQAAAALRVAMNSTDTAKLEAALAEAEAADLGEVGLLQRARVLLDKRRKKDQVRAAAEKARLRAQKKEEARKGRKAKAAAGAGGPAAGEPQSAGQRGRFSDMADAASDTGADAARSQPRRASAPGDDGPGDGGGATPAPAPPPGKLRRLLQLFGLGQGGSSGGGGSGAATAAASSQPSSGAPSRTSSSSLSWAPSAPGGGIPAAEPSPAAPAADPPAAVAVPPPPRAPSLQQSAPPAQQQAHTAGKEPSPAPSKQQKQQLARQRNPGSSSNGSLPELSAAAANATPSSAGSSTVAAAGSSSSSGGGGGSSSSSASSSSGRSAAVASHPISTEPSGSSDGVCASGDAPSSPTSPAPASGSPTAPPPHKAPPGSKRTARVTSAEAAAAVVAASDQQELHSWLPKQVPAPLRPRFAADAKGKADKGKGAKGKGSAGGGKAGADAAAPAPLVSLSGRKLHPQQQRGVAGAGVTAPATPPAAFSAGARPSHYVPGATWALAGRAAAVSDDGSSASSAAYAGGTSTPNKPKLNPKAAPYTPSHTLAPKAHPAAVACGRMQSPGGAPGSLADWRPPPASGALAVRGASPAAPGGLLEPGLVLGGGYHQLGGIAHHQQQQLGAADAVLGGYARGLAAGAGFDGGSLSSPPGGHVSPQQHRARLLELLSAAGDGGGGFPGLVPAGGSAPLGAGALADGCGLPHAAAAGSQRSSYSSVQGEYGAYGAGAAQRGGRCGVPPGFDAVFAAAPARLAGVLPLSLDDDQLPPGFSAEDYTTVATPASAGALVSPPASAAVPTTAPLGVFAGASVWAPLAATAGSAASSVAASMRSLWPAPPLATSSALPTPAVASPGGGHGNVHGYTRSQDLDLDVAAAATSANVAELVLGSSPGLAASGAAAEAQMSKLAEDIMAIVAE